MKKIATKEIIDQLKEKNPGLTAQELKKIYEDVVGIFEEVVTNRDTLYIKTLGTFKPATTKERVGRNMHSGESLKIPETNKIKFSINRGLKRKLNSNVEDKQAAKEDNKKKPKAPKKKATKKNPYKKGK